MTINIIKDWKNPDLRRQTPSHSGYWEGHKFLFDSYDEDYDLLVVLNRPPKEIKTMLPKGNAWLISQEPPTEMHKWHTKSFKHFDKIFTQRKSINNRIINSHGALPWHIDKSYDDLSKIKIQMLDKKKDLSIISSNLQILEGHKKRFHFTQKLKNNLKLDLYGRGLNPISDKYDALAPYKYSIAIENSRYNDYWTEKISDCFLSYTIPIYYGCPNISRYFPKESYIEIDINNFDSALSKIKETVTMDYWKANFQYLEEARNLVLNKYQLFPFITERIVKYCSTDTTKRLKIIPSVETI